MLAGDVQGSRTTGRFRRLVSQSGIQLNTSLGIGIHIESRVAVRGQLGCTLAMNGKIPHRRIFAIGNPVEAELAADGSSGGFS
jgi:hypothetical protein